MIRRASFKKTTALIMSMISALVMTQATPVAASAERDEEYFTEMLEDVKKLLPDVKVTEISENKVQGILFEPEEKVHDGVVLAVSGSDGTYDYDAGLNLSNEGYTVFLFSYFNRPNLPKNISKVPVDKIMEEVIDFLKKNDIDTEPMTLMGTSRGSEFAQVAAQNFKEITNIVLMAPFCYAIGHSYSFTTTGPWTINGKAVPYIKPQLDDVVMEEYIRAYESGDETFEYRRVYDNMFKNVEGEPEQLKLDKFKGKILIFTGDDDRLAPTEIMGQKIYDKYPDQTELHIFKDAGHAFSPTDVLTDIILNGGTAIGNEDAYYESQQFLLDFLEEYHD